MKARLVFGRNEKGKNILYNYCGGGIGRRLKVRRLPNTQMRVGTQAKPRKAED